MFTDGFAALLRAYASEAAIQSIAFRYRFSEKWKDKGYCATYTFLYLRKKKAKQYDEADKKRRHNSPSPFLVWRWPGWLSFESGQQQTCPNPTGTIPNLKLILCQGRIGQYIEQQQRVGPESGSPQKGAYGLAVCRPGRCGFSPQPEPKQLIGR
ncbi:hypothetical protein PGRAT_20505 [Paenibacillus graminis]|uniref:Uncharacterized protein n=1 Tax=Paenibacillus graminis TaxID=189425 RepID=A0A089ME37_9BACL|nr:hypothetical protein PGRAT_20505 [Paenibacillus graminis]